MPFTPESMLRAETLDRPHVVIDAADPLRFYVEWAYHAQDGSKIDPIVELFRPLRDKIRKEHDVHIVVATSFCADKEISGNRISRTYILSYCPGERRLTRAEEEQKIYTPSFRPSRLNEQCLIKPEAHGKKQIDVAVSGKMLESEFKAIQPRLLASLQEVLDAWVEADNGLALFLEEGNKESIHSFLLSIGLRKPEPPEEPTKEERRRAYLKAHPEHARTATPRKK